MYMHLMNHTVHQRATSVYNSADDLSQIQPHPKGKPYGWMTTSYCNYSQGFHFMDRIYNVNLRTQSPWITQHETYYIHRHKLCLQLVTDLTSACDGSITIALQEFSAQYYVSGCINGLTPEMNQMKSQHVSLCINQYSNHRCMFLHSSGSHHRLSFLISVNDLLYCMNDKQCKHAI
eukprot:302508_1